MRRLAGLLLALALGTAGAQATVSVSADLATPLPASAISGFNYGNSMRVVGWQERFDALNITSLRFPPGNVADEIALNQAAVDALVQNWRLLGEPEITFVVNLFSGNPAETLEAMQLLNKAGLPVTLWELGNEPDLYATNRSAPAWTPARYCEASREHAAAIWSALPGARLAGPGVSGGRPSALNYLHEVIQLCGDVFDVITFHVYPTDGTWEDGAALATSSLLTGEIALVRGWLQDEAGDRFASGLPELGVTEFGLSWRTSNFHHLEDMPAALWLADTLGQLAEAGVDYSHYFALQAMGGHGLLDSSGWVRPTWHVYNLLAGFVGESLTTTVSGAAGLTAYAARDKGTLTLLLVNRSTSELDVALALPAATVRVLSDAVFDDTGEPQTLALAPDAPLLLPARSLAVITTTAPSPEAP